MKNNCLESMGIVVWRLRESMAVSNTYFCCYISSATGKSQGLLLADKDNAMSASEQENLLKKMAGALTTGKIDIKIITQDDVAHCLSSTSFSFLIFLGEKIKKIKVDLKKSNTRIIYSFSLSYLLHHTEDKKIVWSDIKPLRDCLQ